MKELRQSAEDEEYQREIADAPRSPAAPKSPSWSSQAADALVSHELSDPTSLYRQADLVAPDSLHAPPAIKKGIDFADRYANPVNAGVNFVSGKTPKEWAGYAADDPKSFAKEVGKGLFDSTGVGMGVNTYMDMKKGPPGAPATGAPAAPGPMGAPADGEPNAEMSPVAQPHMVGAANMDLTDPRYQQWMRETVGDEMGHARGQSQAANELGGALADQKLSEAAGHMLMSEGREQMAGDTRARADVRAQDAARQRAHIDAVSNSINERSREDPDQWWHQQSAPKVVGWTIATFLGGFGKGENEVLKQIREHVTDNISAQRQDYQHDRNRLDDMNNLYAQAYKATGDHDAAFDLAQQWQLGALQDKVQAMAAGTGSNVELAKGKMLAEAIERERSQIGEKGILHEERTHKYVPAHMEGGGAGAGTAPDWEVQRKITEALEKAKVPAMRANLGNLKHLLADPGLQFSATDRALLTTALATGNTGVLQVAIARMDPKARQLASAIFNTSVTGVSEEGMKHFGLVTHNYGKLLGTGSREDILNAIQNEDAENNGRYRDAVAGFHPAQVQLHDYLRSTVPIPRDMQSNKSTPTPGFKGD